MVRLEVQRSSMRNVWSSDSDTSNLRLPSSLCACRARGPRFSGRHLGPAAPAAHLSQAADGRSAPAKYGSLLCEEAGQCMRYCWLWQHGSRRACGCGRPGRCPVSEAVPSQVRRRLQKPHSKEHSLGAHDRSTLYLASLRSAQRRARASKAEPHRVCATARLARLQRFCCYSVFCLL